MRVVARAVFGALVVLAASAIALLSVTVRAETIRFSAQLTNDVDTPAKPGAGAGRVHLSLDTASKVASWTIEYSGFVQSPKGIACGALETPGGPAILLTSNLASPITGSKALTAAEIATLTAGRWVCVVSGEGDEAEIGGELQPAR